VEGQWVVLYRPPCLSHSSYQPVKVVYTEGSSIQLNTDLCDQLQGDFDGDEVIIAAVSSPDAIDQCDTWVRTEIGIFNDIKACYSGVNGYDNMGSGYYTTGTTICFEDLEDGAVMPDQYKSVKYKDHCITECALKLRNPPRENVVMNFIADYLRGQSDISTQQLSQGYIGSISRQAKLAACSFTVNSDGYLIAHMADGDFVMTDFKFNTISPGNLTVRGINVFCKAAQQALLDAHKGVAEGASSIDLVGSLLQGSTHCLVLFSTSAPADLATSLTPKFNHVIDGVIYLVIDPMLIKDSYVKHIVGAYDPLTLLRYEALIQSRQSFVDICKRCITVICNYQGLKIIEDELNAIALMYTFQVSSSRYPITNNKGYHEKGPRWMMDIVCSHYEVIQGHLAVRTAFGNNWKSGWV
jgi:hypothetical protein